MRLFPDCSLAERNILSTLPLQKGPPHGYQATEPALATRGAALSRGSGGSLLQLINAATCSAAIITGRWVLAEGTAGRIEASTTRSPRVLWTRPCSSTTAPMAQVPTG